MFLVNTTQKEDVQKIILALLVSRKGATPLTQLDKEYLEQEGERIPWKQFGHISLLHFLRSMPECIHIENRDGTNYVRGIPNKSKHVSSLVERQKFHLRRKTNERRKYKPSMYCSKVQLPNMCVGADIMAYVIHYVRQSGAQGISKSRILQIINEKLPHFNVMMKDLEDYVKKIPHQLCMSNDLLFAVAKDKPLSEGIQNKIDSYCMEDRAMHYCVSGEDRKNDEDANFEFLSTDSPVLSCSEKTKKSVCNFSEGTVTTTNIKSTPKDCRTTAYFWEVQNGLAKEYLSDEDNYQDYLHLYNEKLNGRIVNQDVDSTVDQTSKLICERTRFRLKELIEQYPDGIWCSELPSAYLAEYKVPLNYADLGFDSVLHFASYLPEIFSYAELPNSVGDFKLYAASMNMDKEVRQKQNMAHVNSMYDRIKCTWGAIPPSITVPWYEQLVPTTVMAHGECVGQIYVLDLLHTEMSFLEVFVVEVFNPSFFWIHLRKNYIHFKNLMSDLNVFYNLNCQDYLMPALVFEVGMNCACMYDNVWHRGIIQSVEPDMKVVVMFYDYGTLKACEPREIYFLHRQFSNIPAQAVPCGLYNVKPLKGDQWPKSVTHRFAVRTDKIPLAASIKSLDESDNSMMITLTDTLAEEDVNLNEWLVQENLASYGKLVGIWPRNFAFHSYIKYQKASKKNPHVVSKCDLEMKEVSQYKSQGRVNSAVHNLYNSMKRVQFTIRRRLSKNYVNAAEDNSDNILSKEECVSTDGSRKCQRGHKLMSLHTESASNFTISKSEQMRHLSVISEPLTDRKKLSAKNAMTQERMADTHTYLSTFNENVVLKDLDNITDGSQYFGTFKSLCGGHGRMEHIDWTSILNSMQDRGKTSEHIQASVVNVSDTNTCLTFCKNELLNKYEEPNCLRNNNLFMNKTSIITLPHVCYEEKQLDLSSQKFDMAELNATFLNFIQRIDHYLQYDENTCFSQERNIIKTGQASTLTLTRRKEALNSCNTQRKRIVIAKDIFDGLTETMYFKQNIAATRDSPKDNVDDNYVKVREKSITMTSNAIAMIRDQYGASDSDTEIEINCSENKKILCSPGLSTLPSFQISGLQIQSPLTLTDIVSMTSTSNKDVQVIRDKKKNNQICNEVTCKELVKPLYLLDDQENINVVNQSVTVFEKSSGSPIFVDVDKHNKQGKAMIEGNQQKENVTSAALGQNYAERDLRQAIDTEKYQNKRERDHLETSYPPDEAWDESLEPLILSNYEGSTTCALHDSLLLMQRCKVHNPYECISSFSMNSDFLSAQPNKTLQDIADNLTSTVINSPSTILQRTKNEITHQDHDSKSDPREEDNDDMYCHDLLHNCTSHVSLDIMDHNSLKGKESFMKTADLNTLPRQNYQVFDAEKSLDNEENLIYKRSKVKENSKELIATDLEQSNCTETQIESRDGSTTTVHSLLHMNSKSTSKTIPNMPVYNDENIESDESIWDAFAEQEEIGRLFLYRSSELVQASNVNVKK